MFDRYGFVLRGSFFTPNLRLHRTPAAQLSRKPLFGSG
jgi:hypothetical protein